MKWFVCLVCAVSLSLSLFAQEATLSLTTAKTTAVVFPHPVKHVDRGSSAILADLASGEGNILLLRAAVENFEETNLNVITANGILYTFLVCYEAAPKTLTVHAPLQKSAPLSTYAMMVLDNPPLYRRLWKESWGIRALVDGVYVRNNALLLQLRITNGSSLDYEIDYLRFVICDRKQGKRTAMQEQPLQPLFIQGAYKGVKAGGSSRLVVVLPQMTLPDKKYMAVEIGEKGGGRHLRLLLRNHHLVYAQPLPDLP
ncbi:MAG TPA: conjugative transposon protein TraN [Flavisolibacter sp.]|jgi:conjugative transposon TraN protein|nr:conjugative transposon protein TraN [Flavisolibacter sp.]